MGAGQMIGEGRVMGMMGEGTGSEVDEKGGEDTVKGVREKDDVKIG